MKTILQGLAIGLSIFGLIYLTFAFGTAEFNISLWPYAARAFCAFVGIIAITASIGITVHINDSK